MFVAHFKTYGMQNDDMVMFFLRFFRKVKFCKIKAAYSICESWVLIHQDVYHDLFVCS